MGSTVVTLSDGRTATMFTGPFDPPAAETEPDRMDNPNQEVVRPERVPGELEPEQPEPEPAPAPPPVPEPAEPDA